MLKKRGSVWHVDIVSPNGQRIRCSAKTADKRLAQELHDRIKAESWGEAVLQKKRPRTFAEAADRWEREHSADKAINDYRHHLAFWRGRAGSMRLDAISRSWAADALNKMITRHGTIPSDGTKQNYIITLRSVLNAACREWEWLDSAPSFAGFASKKRGSNVIATPDQARRLIAALPQELRGPVTFAFATGLRKSNVFGLTWDRVDFERRIAWVNPIDTKAGNLIVCPLNQTAISVLEAIGSPYSQNRVFPVSPPQARVWNRCTASVGLAGFRFHDIRHTFATWLVMDGADKKTVQDACGWLSPAMLDNYVHLPQAHLIAASDRISDRLN